MDNQQENAQLYEALKWLFNLYNGITKSGHRRIIYHSDWQEAINFARQVLESYEQTAEGGEDKRDGLSATE